MDVYDAYSGAHHKFQTNFESLSTLANEIHSTCGLGPDHQLLLVDPSGSRLKLEAIVEGQRVYVYNKSLISEQLSSPDCPQFDQMEESLDEAMAHGKWALKCAQSLEKPFNYIKSTKESIKVILHASNLAIVHMHTHLKALCRSRDKKEALFNQVSDDLAACKHWQNNWDTLERIPGVGTKLDILDKPKISEAWVAATTASDDIKRLLASLDIDQKPSLPTAPTPTSGDEDLLKVDMTALCSKLVDDAAALERADPEEREALETKMSHSDITAEVSNIYQECVQLATDTFDNLVQTQAYLVKVIRQVSLVQTSSAKSKKIIKEISDHIYTIDQNKMHVAKVIDFPFIYGVGLIEISRRRSWSAAVKHLTNSALSHFEQLRTIEYERIDRWTSRYSSLNMIDKIVSVDVKLPVVSMDYQEPQFDESTEIIDYFHVLESQGFHEAADELRSELDAMSHQLEKSFRATSKARSLFPDMDASQVIHQEHQQMRAARTSPPPQEIERRVRAILEPQIKAELEAKLKAELSAKIERDLRAKLKIELTAEIEAKLDAKLAAQIQEKNTEVKQVLETNEGLKNRISELEDMRCSEIAELQEQINAFENKSSELSIQEETNMSKSWAENLQDKTHDLSQRLYANSHNLEIVLEKMGLQTTRKIEDGMVGYSINRVRGLSRRSSRSKENVSGSSTLLTSSEVVVPPAPKIPDPALLHWVSQPNNDDEYRLFIQEVYIDYDIFRQVVGDRFADVEKIARKYHAEVKTSREKIRQLEQSIRYRLALSQFKVGDLILFLPTRDVARSPNPWAAFNINCPHYFLDPKNTADIGNREFLVGRATAITQHKVLQGDSGDKNPFNLPEGLRWNMITAHWK